MSEQTPYCQICGAPIRRKAEVVEYAPWFAGVLTFLAISVSVQASVDPFLWYYDVPLRLVTFYISAVLGFGAGVLLVFLRNRFRLKWNYPATKIRH